MTRITIAKGDGIGPEIMDATLAVLEAAGADLQVDEVEVGEKVYLAGYSAGITPEGWETIRRNKVFLKAPITTPQGGGYKSLNVSTRKFLGLFANVRPCRALDPYVRTKHPGMDVVIIRENEEDLYAGIEHQQTDEVVQCLKLISRPGCERIVRYAFEYAKVNGRKKVTCFTKDNIMKQTDGLFHAIFDEIGKEYPDIEYNEGLIDTVASKMAMDPMRYDVIVTTNQFGDILTDEGAGLVGGLGLAPGLCVGANTAMAQATHGSAPDIAGKNIANPYAMIMSGQMLLEWLGRKKKEPKSRTDNARL